MDEARFELTWTLPRLDNACFACFLQQLRHTFPEACIVLVCDSSGSHTSGQAVGQALTPLALPADSPESHPAERCFKELRKALARQVFDDLDALEQALTRALRTY